MTKRPRFERMQISTSSGTQGSIREFLNKLLPQMQALVRNAGTVSALIPSWKIDASGDQTFADHVQKLQIPSVLGRPCLLLHDLGVPGSLNRQSAEHIESIFKSEWMYVIFLIQTVSFRTDTFYFRRVLTGPSGSGKTRALLEGLCSRWGFYFVAKPGADGIGSPDVWLTCQDLHMAMDYRRAKAKNGDYNTVLRNIEQITKPIFTPLLLARFLILNLLIKVAKNQDPTLKNMDD